MSSRVFADIVNVHHFYQRPLPYLAEIQGQRSRQRRICILDPKIGHFGQFTNQEGLWWNGDPLSRVPPMSAAESAINYTN